MHVFLPVNIELRNLWPVDQCLNHNEQLSRDKRKGRMTLHWQVIEKKG